MSIPITRLIGSLLKQSGAGGRATAGGGKAEAARSEGWRAGRGGVDRRGSAYAYSVKELRDSEKAAAENAEGAYYQIICDAWADDPSIFKVDPHHLVPEPRRCGCVIPEWVAGPEQIMLSCFAQLGPGHL